jgi:hypothetical protein
VPANCPAANGELLLVVRLIVGGTGGGRDRKRDATNDGHGTGFDLPLSRTVTVTRVWLAELVVLADEVGIVINGWERNFWIEP